MITSTLAIVVKVEHPEGFSAADINDAIAFHLGTTDLDSIEADVSAVTILSSRALGGLGVGGVAEAEQKRWAEPMTATHVAGVDVWTLEAHDDQPIEGGRQYAADLRVSLLLNGEQYYESTYPSYRIWTLYAHWTEGLPDLTTGPEGGVT